MRQIIPAESNGIDAVNFRTMRESRSVDFGSDLAIPMPTGPNGLRLDSRDMIHGMAGSPSAGIPGTPGMPTPKELNGRGDMEEKGNPFEDFNSVTRDVGDF